MGRPWNAGTRRSARTGVCIGVALGAAACSLPKVEPNVESAVPEERILGAIDAMRENDPDAARAFVTMLDSQDPALRMVAIYALYRMTGDTKGYDFAAPEAERTEAVGRWVAWVDSGGPDQVRESAEPGP